MKFTILWDKLLLFYWFLLHLFLWMTLVFRLFNLQWACVDTSASAQVRVCCIYVLSSCCLLILFVLNETQHRTHCAFPSGATAGGKSQTAVTWNISSYREIVSYSLNLCKFLGTISRQHELCGPHNIEHLTQSTHHQNAPTTLRHYTRW